MLYGGSAACTIVLLTQLQLLHLSHKSRSQQLLPDRTTSCTAAFCCCHTHSEANRLREQLTLFFNSSPFLQVIIVMDPAAAGKPRLPIIRRSSDIKLPPREKRYVFDKAYDGNTDNRTLYNGTFKASYPGLLTWSICSVPTHMLMGSVTDTCIGNALVMHC